MKINEGLRVAKGTLTSTRHPQASDKLSFQDMLKNQEGRMTKEQMTRLLSQIEKQGERLNLLRTAKELGSYKKLIKQFVGEAVHNGVSLENRHGLNTRGRDRKLKLLKRLDKKLLELTDAVLGDQKKSINLLAQIGEIKGLLVNLYF